jgi:hypothetical protein
MRDISWLAEGLLASQEGLWAMELVNWLDGWFVGELVNNTPFF